MDSMPIVFIATSIIQEIVNKLRWTIGTLVGDIVHPVLTVKAHSVRLISTESFLVAVRVEFENYRYVDVLLELVDLSGGAIIGQFKSILNRDADPHEPLANLW